MALLRTNSQIRAEAGALFWKENTFHFTLRPNDADPDTIKRVKLDLAKIKHLSVDYSTWNNVLPVESQRSAGSGQRRTCAREGRVTGAGPSIAHRLAFVLRQLSSHVTRLETFTLHMVTGMCCSNCGMDWLQTRFGEESPGMTLLLPALKHITKRVTGRVSFVGLASEDGRGSQGGQLWFNEHGWMPLRQSIAPLDAWTVEKFGGVDWPGLKLEDREELEILSRIALCSERLCGHKKGGCCVRRWSWFPEGSKLKMHFPPRDWRDIKKGQDVLKVVRAMCGSHYETILAGFGGEAALVLGIEELFASVGNP